MTTDVILTSSPEGYLDITWTDSGDIETGKTLDTAILMSIFCEVRAASYEILSPEMRRGWIGNETTKPFEQGSKQWLFEQSRVTGSVLAELGTIINNSLQWMIEDNIAVSVFVEQPFLSNGKVCVNIQLGRNGSPVDRRYYELWENTPFEG